MALYYAVAMDQAAWDARGQACNKCLAVHDRLGDACRDFNGRGNLEISGYELWEYDTADDTHCRFIAARDGGLAL